MDTKTIILGTSQTMINNAGQDWTGSLSPTIQILINKVLRTSQTMTNKVMGSGMIILGTSQTMINKVIKIIILGTSQTMINNAGQDWTGSLSPTFQILINKVLKTSQTMTYFRKAIPTNNGSALKTKVTMVNGARSAHSTLLKGNLFNWCATFVVVILTKIFKNSVFLTISILFFLFSHRLYERN